MRGTRDDLVYLDVLIGVRRTATNVTAIVAADQTACRPACWSKRPAWTTSPRLSPFPWKESTDDRPRLHCVGCPLVASPHGVAVYPLAARRAGIDPWAGSPEAALGVVCTAWLVALQAPVCFRFGYTTSRFVMIIVALLVVCAVMGWPRSCSSRRPCSPPFPDGASSSGGRHRNRAVDLPRALDALVPARREL